MNRPTELQTNFIGHTGGMKQSLANPSIRLKQDHGGQNGNIFHFYIQSETR